MNKVKKKHNFKLNKTFFQIIQHSPSKAQGWDKNETWDKNGYLPLQLINFQNKEKPPEFRERMCL